MIHETKTIQLSFSADSLIVQMLSIFTVPLRAPFYKTKETFSLVPSVCPGGEWPGVLKKKCHYMQWQGEAKVCLSLKSLFNHNHQFFFVLFLEFPQHNPITASYILPSNPSTTTFHIDLVRLQFIACTGFMMRLFSALTILTPVSIV